MLIIEYSSCLGPALLRFSYVLRCFNYSNFDLNYKNIRKLYLKEEYSITVMQSNIWSDYPETCMPIDELH